MESRPGPCRAPKPLECPEWWMSSVLHHKPLEPRWVYANGVTEDGVSIKTKNNLLVTWNLQPHPLTPEKGFSESHSVLSDSLRPHGLYSPWDCPGQNTGVGSRSLLQGIFPTPRIEPRSPSLHADSLWAEPQGKPKDTGVGSLFLLQRIFPTQESNQGLLHCRWILYQLSYQESLGRGFGLQIKLYKNSLMRRWDELQGEWACPPVGVWHSSAPQGQKHWLLDPSRPLLMYLLTCVL